MIDIEDISPGDVIKNVVPVEFWCNLLRNVLYMSHDIVLYPAGEFFFVKNIIHSIYNDRHAIDLIHMSGQKCYTVDQLFYLFKKHEES